MKELTAVSGEKILVDDEDYSILSRRKWHIVHVSDQTTYATTPLKIGKNWTKIAIHRLIMNPAEGLDVDHVDSDGLNNQKENLRVCTRQENLRAKRKPRMGNPEGIPYKGVCRTTDHKRWRANICTNEKYQYLGSFDTAEEAALAYNQAAIKIFGKFARLNKIEGV